WAIGPGARSEGCRGLETRDELARLANEVGTHGGRNRLAGDELLAERVHVRAVVHDPVVEVWAGCQPGRADVADDLFLVHPRAGSDVRRDPRQVVVLRFVARAMANVHLDAVATVPARLHDHAIGDGANRRADGRGVVDREV